MDNPSINRIAQLQQMIADLAKIQRAVPLADTSKAENDVEHSYGLAITCWYLHGQIAPDLDLAKILQYALSHDVVELHAGDTFPWDTEAVKTKYTRERDALEIISADWPDFPELVLASKAYADKINDEAKFTYAVDKLLPALMVELAPDKTIWKNLNLSLAMMRENKKTILQSDILAPYYEKLLQWLDERNTIPKE